MAMFHKKIRRFNTPDGGWLRPYKEEARNLLLSNVEKEIGVTFKNKDLLKNAFVLSFFGLSNNSFGVPFSVSRLTANSISTGQFKPSLPSVNRNLMIIYGLFLNGMN